jgi:hypothetical protein
MNIKQLSRETRLTLARDANTDAETLAAIHGDREITLAIAKHPNTSAVTLGSLAYYDDPYIRDAVASNRNTSVLHLAKLASDCLSSVRYIIAGRADAPPIVLALMAGYPYDLFHGCNQSEEHFDESIVTQYWDIGCLLAANPSTPKRSLTKFWRAHANGRRWDWTETIIRMRRTFREKYPAASVLR